MCDLGNISLLVARVVLCGLDFKGITHEEMLSVTGENLVVVGWLYCEWLHRHGYGQWDGKEQIWRKLNRLLNKGKKQKWQCIVFPSVMWLWTKIHGAILNILITYLLGDSVPDDTSFGMKISGVENFGSTFCFSHSFI